MLWSLACRGRHESEEHLIYDIVRRLSDHLPLTQLKFIFKKVIMCDMQVHCYLLSVSHLQTDLANVTDRRETI
jgi:hypothetical protein